MKCFHSQNAVRRVLLDSKEAQQTWRVVWKYVSTKHGALSVIMAGLSMMPMLSASNWGTLKLVMLIFHNVTLMNIHK